jgi:hypothetical protein
MFTPPSVRPLAVVVIVLTLALVAVSEIPAAENSEESSKAGETKWGTFGLEFRYRFPWIDDDAFTEAGYASSLRTGLSYETPGWHGLAAYFQFVDVSNLGAADKHNDTQNGETSRPVEADPEDTQMAQLLVRYDGLADTDFVAGRQEVNLGTQRYVGAVAWRQTHQTLDAFKVANGSIPHTTWTYAYVDQANTVNLRTDDMKTHLFNAAIHIDQWGTLTPYYYSIDYQDTPRLPFSSASYGARWQGTSAIGEWSLPYIVELAQQDDLGDNPGTIDAGYYHLQAGANRNNIWFNVGLEVLEGSVADGQFNTPLATLHKFNGWADKFLVTPVAGLEDAYVTVGGSVGKVAIFGRLHDFSSDTLSIDYGQELDAQASYKAPWKQTFAMKFAYYSADDLLENTFKVWVWTSWKL